MGQNDELRQACEAWIQSIISSLKHTPLPLKDDQEITFLDNGGHRSVPIKRPDPMAFYATYRDRLFNLPEFIKIIEITLNNPALFSILCFDPSGNVPSEPASQKYNLKQYFARLLLEYLQTNPNPPFSPATFNRLYEKLEEFIYSTQSIDGVWSVHIRNLKSDLDTIKIKSGVYLRQLPMKRKLMLSS